MGIAADFRSSTPFGGAGGTTYVWKMLANINAYMNMSFSSWSGVIICCGEDINTLLRQMNDTNEVMLSSNLSHEKDPLTFHYTDLS